METLTTPEAAGGSGRRDFARALGGAFIATAAALTLADKTARAQTTAITDTDILNFALNLEYLEGEYYVRSAFGRGLADADVGGASAGPVTGGRQVPFTTSAVRQFAEEIAQDEELHIRFLRSQLGSAAVPRPAINFTDAFNTAAQAAGLGDTFDPFASELFFLHGAFALTDVGVTAYKGSAALIQSKAILSAAAGILATEAYHDSILRTLLYQQQATEALPGKTVAQVVQAISDLRDATDGATDDDQGVVLNGQANVVPTDQNALVFGRAAGQVLRIVYLKSTPGATDRGGFFPSGVNGNIRTSAG